ncbi:hypothetical protein J2S35_000906 [Falsarthrobacter nasiphocae]|uniref:Uncharacterized protein n=1 Tax=Falsarthrobacter nasiphocae TaxID=189863 RepID=A0AAE4C544_9MICC|nr:hypothetical protein [Falsarthrobacter nasiphocae]
MAEARKAVYGDLVTSMRIENFFNEAPRTATDAMKRAEKSLKSAAYGYEKCMKAAGYPVKLGEAPKLAAEKWGQYRADGAPVHEEEKAMIRQDVACQKAENIREDVDNAVLDGLGSWARGNEEKIVELSTLTQESLERARKILSE